MLDISEKATSERATRIRRGDGGTIAKVASEIVESAANPAQAALAVVLLASRITGIQLMELGRSLHALAKGN